MYNGALSLVSALFFVGKPSILRETEALPPSCTFVTPISWLQKCNVLHCRGTSASKDMSNDHDHLFDIPHVKRKQIETRHANIAKHVFSSNAFIRPTEEWFLTYLGLVPSEQKRFQNKLPDSISGKSTIERLGRHRLHEWFAFFLDRNTLGLNHKQLRKMVLSRPNLLSYKLSNIKATTTFFQDELELSRDDIISILQSYPSVLMHSIDNRLRPTANFLKFTVLCTDHRVKRICTSYPNIFSHSIEKTFLPKLAFLKELGLNRSEISQVVAKFAPILWLSEDNLKSKIQFLSDSLGMKNFELRIVVLSYPQILGLSIESNLNLKMRFFLDPEEIDSNFAVSLQDVESNLINCGLTKRQLKDLVLYQPAILAYSLERRLKPRMKSMQDYNISFLYSPKNIMSYTDEKFNAWLSSQTSSWSLV